MLSFAVPGDTGADTGDTGAGTGDTGDGGINGDDDAVFSEEESEDEVTVDLRTSFLSCSDSEEVEVLLLSDATASFFSPESEGPPSFFPAKYCSKSCSFVVNPLTPSTISAETPDQASANVFPKEEEDSDSIAADSSHCVGLPRRSLWLCWCETCSVVVATRCSTSLAWAKHMVLGKTYVVRGAGHRLLGERGKRRESKRKRRGTFLNIFGERAGRAGREEEEEEKPSLPKLFFPERYGGCI